MRSSSASRAQLHEYTGGTRADGTKLPAVVVERPIDARTFVVKQALLHGTCNSNEAKLLATGGFSCSATIAAAVS